MCIILFSWKLFFLHNTMLDIIFFIQYIHVLTEQFLFHHHMIEKC